MKRDSTLIILLVSFLLIFSGAYIFLESKQDKLNESAQTSATPTPSPQGAKDDTATDAADTQPATGSADEELEAMPTVSEEVDLDTIEQELDETQILEEDFSEL